MWVCVYADVVDSAEGLIIRVFNQHLCVFLRSEKEKQVLAFSGYIQQMELQYRVHQLKALIHSASCLQCSNVVVFGPLKLSMSQSSSSPTGSLNMTMKSLYFLSYSMTPQQSTDLNPLANLWDVEGPKQLCEVIILCQYRPNDLKVSSTSCSQHC